MLPLKWTAMPAGRSRATISWILSIVPPRTASMRSSSKLIRMEATRPFFDSRSPTSIGSRSARALIGGGVDRPGAIDQRLDAYPARLVSHPPSYPSLSSELLPIASTVFAVARLWTRCTVGTRSISLLIARR